MSHQLHIIHSDIFLIQVGGLAIGFMCVSTEVDVELLNQCFELKPYTFLHKFKKKGDTSDDQTSIASDRFLNFSFSLSFILQMLNTSDTFLISNFSSKNCCLNSVSEFQCCRGRSG